MAIEQTLKSRLAQLATKLHASRGRLVDPARAAANQMKDAGMVEGAAPLYAALFEIDAIEAEITQLFEADQKGALAALVELITGTKHREGGFE